MGKVDLLLLPPLGRVLEELLDEVDVRHDHSTAAVPLQTKGVHCRAVVDALVEELQVALPQIASDLATREAADRDDHFGCDLPAARGCNKILCVYPEWLRYVLSSVLRTPRCLA